MTEILELTVSPRTCSLRHSISRPLRMSFLAQRNTPDATQAANGISPQREPPKVRPRMTMTRKMAATRPLARFSSSSNSGWNVTDGVGWKRMFVFSPCIGTSEVVTWAIGSGGALISWLCLYSVKSWLGSVFTFCVVVSCPYLFICWSRIQTYGWFVQIGVRNSQLLAINIIRILFDSCNRRVVQDKFFTLGSFASWR